MMTLDRRTGRTLKKLWADGLSASQIAAELGGITRNAVIGKVHRLGLSGRAKSPSSSAPRGRASRAPAAHAAGVAAGDARQHRARALHAYDYDIEAEPELIENVIPMGQRRTLLELNEDTCRWPIGDPAQHGLLLLRRQAGGEPALLRATTRASPISRATARRDRRRRRGTERAQAAALPKRSSSA